MPALLPSWYICVEHPLSSTIAGVIMRRFLPLFLLLLLASAAAGQVPELSFKGIRLGMTRDEVNRLVDSSRWGYVNSFGYGNSNADTIDADHSSFLGAEGYDLAEERQRDSLHIIGCPAGRDPINCIRLQVVELLFSRGRIYEVVIHFAPQIWPVDHLRMSAEAIANKYGPSTSGLAWFEEIDGKVLLQLKPDTRYTLVDWVWSAPKKKGKKVERLASISLCVEPVAADQYEPTICITDHRAELQFLLDEQQREKNATPAKAKTEF